MSSLKDLSEELATNNKSYQSRTEDIPCTTFAEKHKTSFQSVLNARRAIRLFTGERIPETTMREILADAILTPTSSNLQTYELYWVKNSEKRALLATACMEQPAAKTAGELIVIVSRPDLWRTNRDKLLQIMTEGGAKLPESVLSYYNKIIPQVMRTDVLGLSNFMRRVLFFVIGLTRPIVRTPVSSADHRIYGHTQSALVAQTLMLSLTAHGYDSCPLGGIDAARIHNLLNLPRCAEVAMVIATGTRKPEGLYGPRVRLEFSHLVKEI